MGYVLMWIESLSAMLLLVAGILAWRWQTQRRQLLARAALAAVMFLAVLPPAAVVIFNIAFKEKGATLGYGTASVLWLLAFLGGSVALILKARKDAGGTRTAATWPIGRLLAACAAAAVLNLITFLNMDAMMNAKLATLRMEAGAMALSSAPPRLTDRDNAALVYEKAFDAMKRVDAKTPNLGKRHGQWFKDYNKPDYVIDSELREYLQLQKGSLALLRRGAAMPGCYFDRDYSNPSLDMQLPELAQMRAGARLLAVSARARAADGDVKGAVEDVAAIWSMSRHMMGEPLLISGLVSVAMANIGDLTLEGVLRTRTPSAQDLAPLVNDTISFYPRALRRCLMTEQAFGLSAFAMLSGDQDAKLVYQSIGLRGELDSVVGPLWRVFLLSDDLHSYRKYMNELRNAAMQNYKAYKPRIDQGARRIEGGILTHLIAPALDRVQVSFLRAEALQRLSEMGVAVAAYRANNGKFPASLEALTPEYLAEIPNDPFDEQPLRYAPAADGVVLYSVGDDLVDDKGVFRDYQGGDIIFRIGNVPDAPVTTPVSAPGKKGVTPAKGSF
ncbi:MAG TPA: hypothetical protein VEK08_03495 [Planctomycetota bacterium]|nr:hypothetical protein [Planctomycetota bacterium]